MAKRQFYIGARVGMTDEQAMWRLVTREDQAAFARLVVRWEEPIRRLCIRMTGDAHRGEDLKQETFVRVFVRRHDFQPDRRFSTWLWRMALNVCYDELRRVRRRGEEVLDETAVEGEASGALEARDPGETAAAEEESELVRQALLQLPEALRTVLVLRHYEGLKFREIAEILNVPEGTASWRAGEGLVRMHALLASKMDQPPGPALRSPRMKKPRTRSAAPDRTAEASNQIQSC